MKKMLFVMNPNAGTRKGPKFLADILSIFNRAGFCVITYMTESSSDAVKIVERHACEVDLVVCSGGDGTFNEAVTGILQSGVNIPIGYIPTGSTNDFASSLHLPMNPVDAAQAIVEGSAVYYDVGLFGSRYFTYVASFGAFTRTSYATPQSVKNALGHTAYLLEGIQELSQIRPFHVKLETDEEIIEDDFLFGAISNSISVGGILTLDPAQVDMRDGKFEILLVRAPRKMSEIPECLQALTTQKYNCQMITFRSASKIQISCDPEMIWTLDGERADGSQYIKILNRRQAIGLIQKG